MPSRSWFNVLDPALSFRLYRGTWSSWFFLQSFTVGGAGRKAVLTAPTILLSVAALGVRVSGGDQNVSKYLSSFCCGCEQYPDQQYLSLAEPGARAGYRNSYLTHGQREGKISACHPSNDVTGFCVILPSLHALPVQIETFSML